MVLYLLNPDEDDVGYLLKDRMMQKGFRYLCKNSEGFELETANLKKNISMLADRALTLNTLNKVKISIGSRIDEYIQELNDLNAYIAKNINKIRLIDAELLLSELYFKSQIYFLYNEVFTYGAMDLVIRQQIANRGLNIEKALLELSNYKGTAVYVIYRTLADFPAPSTKKRFIELEKKNEKFCKAVNELRMRVFEYFEDMPTTSKLYDMIQASKIHAKSMPVKTTSLNMDGVLVQLYTFIVDTQRKLFISQNIYMAATKKIFKRFPRLSKLYGGRKPKGQLLTLYLNASKKVKNYRLAPPNVFYKGFIFNLDKHKRMRLSVLGNNVVEAVISKKVGSVPIIEALKTIQKLYDDRIIEKYESKKKKPKYYVFMLELALGCNLNCTICFNRSFKRQRIITPEEWYKIIYSIPKGSKIILFGGEPFFYPRINKVLDFIQSTNAKERRLWTVESFTNGVLTDKIVNSLKGRDKLKLIFSIDGLSDVHDTIRGKGAFSSAVETIKRLKAETPHEIEVRSVVTAKNYGYIKEFIDFFKALRVDKITFTDLHISGNAEKHLDYVLTANQRATATLQLGTINESVLNNYYSTEEIYPNSCGIGFNRIYIRSDGFVTGCSELDIYETDISNAKLNNKGIIENPRDIIPRFERNEFDSLSSDCAKCGLLYLCGGGCRARALKQTGNINSCDVIQKNDIVRILEKISGN